MGQYYRPVVMPSGKTKNEIVASFNSLDYNQSSKLLGHSYLGNIFVETVESLFMPGGKFHKHRLVWAGDYADPEKRAKTNLYERAEKAFDSTHCVKLPKAFRYLVNHSKRVYVDKARQPKNKYGYRIHPLPLLTCEGNGRGGGDYFTEDEHLLKHIGSWARDIISVEAEIPADYTEIILSF